MEKDLSNYRKSYEKGELLLKEVPQNPMQLFQDWFNSVDSFFTEEETNAMTLSTVGIDGCPKSRIVLLKHFSDAGFIFYTNYTSDKGKAIEANPNVCLSFFWGRAERQVIIKGKAEKVDKALSDDYFKSRPRGSQLGALVSNQSNVIKDRDYLENKRSILEEKYEGKRITRPNNWGGYIVKPFEIEFWQGRSNRLHDRVRYLLSNDSKWNINRLSP